jgi:large subunit ribosomal protein L28
MARICDFTGKGTRSGQNRSHSMRATKRTFKPNLLEKWVTMEDGSRMKLKVDVRLYKKVRGFI